MCDGPMLPAWQARCLDALFAVGGVVPVAAITCTVASEPRVADRNTRAGRLWPAFRSGYIARRSRALRPVDASAVLTRMVRAPLDEVEPLALDVVIQLCPSPRSAPLARLARREVWSLHFGGEAETAADVAPGFWEILNGTAVTTAELISRSDSTTVLLGQAFFSTRAHSYVRTLDDTLFGAADLPARACRAILAGAAPSAAGRSEPASRPPAPAQPTNREMIRFATRLGANFVRSQFMAIAFSPQWNVGVVDAPIHRFLDASFEPSVRWMPKSPRAHFVADPFGLPDGSAREWLVESFDYATNRGIIAAVDPRLPGAPRESVLPVDTHASYPFLIKHRGEVYCVPQLEDAEGIRIFRAVHFPTEWEEAGTLVPDVAARDTTLFEHEGRWWLTYTDAAAPMTDLHAWWSDDLLGEWHPHASNPVKVDARSARPAGTPFVHAGARYRPAQDCSRSYGGGVAICRVDRLTPTEFSEEVVCVIRSMPRSYHLGTHTLASTGDITLVDGKRLVFSLAGTRRALQSRLSRG
jgi:hypothetical protein